MWNYFLDPKDHAPVIVTRKTTDSASIMSLEGYKALEETAYLLRSPKNTRRLFMVVQFSDSLWIHPKFARHLNVSMGKLMSFPHINPYYI
jgi:hypothetical protein